MVLEKSSLVKDDGRSSSSTRMVRLFRLYAPIWMILGLGIVLFLRLIVGVLSFRDCPEAASELEAEIEQAKIELKKRKIIS
jgi:hypothetical protein